MDLFISPHNDDAALFGAYTLMRKKPLVLTVTDSWIQSNRGEVCSADDRWNEDVEAMKILNCPIIRLGLRDDLLIEDHLKQAFIRFVNFDRIYVPALQGGNSQHDMIGRVATAIFGIKCIYYPTYTKSELYTIGGFEIVPTIEEIELKNKALDCYKSQIKINGPHFDAVRGKSEWYI